MATYRELIYIIIDKLKLESDDSIFGEEHITFLINKFRPLILKQRYSDVKKEIPDTNFQSLKLELQASPSSSIGELDEALQYMRTKSKVPSIINLNGGQRIITLSSPNDYWGSNITYVNKDRFKYVGINKFLTQVVYGSINPDGYLYLKSGDSRLTELTSIEITTIFEDPTKVNEFDLDSNGKFKDPLDIECPFEANLVSILIDMVEKELLPSQFRVSDTTNNAKDDAADEYNTHQKAQNNLQNPYSRAQAGA
jgi:hypothetical protein